MKSEPAVLEAWSKELWKDGVQIEDLKQLDRFCVKTAHHTYEITVIDPATAEVLIRGGDFFPEYTEARISGASMGGSFLKVHGIYAGFKMELQVGQRRIVTSPVQGIEMMS